jgi:phage baseplate assembly protein W
VFERIEADTLARIDQAVRVALDRWEPRIAIEDIAFESRREGELLVHLRYRLRATNDVRNLVFPFYVVPAEETA